MNDGKCLFKNIYLFGCVGSQLAVSKIVVVACRFLSSCGTQDVEQVGSEEVCRLSCPRAHGNLVSQPGIGTHILSIRRQILNHSALREVYGE